MKKTKLLILTFLICGAAWSQEPKNKKSNIDAKVAELLSKMTLEEKVGQMTQITVTIFEDPKKPGYFDAAKLKQGIQDYHIGSILNVPNPGAPTLKRWQETMTAISNEV